MTVDVCEAIDNALNIIVSKTKRSGNMNTELKQTVWNRKYSYKSKCQTDG